jgi:hypothetical protein
MDMISGLGRTHGSRDLCSSARLLLPAPQAPLPRRRPRVAQGGAPRCGEPRGNHAHADADASVRRVARVEQFVLSLKDTYATIRVEMDRALVDQTGGFDCEVYPNFVHVYEGTGRVATIPQKLQEAFMELSAAIYESVMTRRAELKNIAKFKEIFKILTDGQYSVL